MQNAALAMMMGASSVRRFAISPAVDGKAVWDLDADGPLNLGAPGTWTIAPVWTFEATTKAWGAGSEISGAGRGSAGGAAIGLVTLHENETYTLYVGASTGAPGGGPPGSAEFSGTSGGGYSGIRTAAGLGKLIAGGAGGAGWGGHGGAGGGLAGNPGSTGALAGTQTVGQLWQGAQGGTYVGPEGTGSGGGGGGGYRGGGGRNDGGGGGGGSGYADPVDVAGAVLFAGSGAGDVATPGNADDPQRGGSGGEGDHGRLILS